MKKRIAHVTFDMHIGGAEQVIYNLIENTDGSKYDLSVICLDQPIGPFGKQLENKGYTLISFDRKPGFDLKMIREIRNYVISNNIDILHCHQYTPYVYGVLAAIFTNCRTIFTEHGRFHPDKRKLKRVLINPLLNMFTDYITAISSATRNALIELENFPDKKVKIVYNGIEDARFKLPRDKGLKKILGISEDAFVLGTVARLDAIKNQKMMIKALQIVLQKFPDTFLIIIGDGPERGSLEALTRELQLNSRVVFAGYKEDTHRYYKIMDIFLLTSFTEGTAMTLLEAMASGLPCIATGVGGNAEVVKDGTTGIITPSDDEEVCAENICGLLGDHELRENMGRSGRRRFEDNFTVDKMVNAYEAMYDGVI